MKKFQLAEGLPEIIPRRVTESVWFSSTDAHELIQYLDERISERQFRLMTCAFCRHLWSLLVAPESRNAVEVAEAFADDHAGIAELDAALLVAGHVYDWSAPLPNAHLSAAYAATHSAARCVDHLLGVFVDAREAAAAAGMPDEDTFQCAIIRDIAGNPFHRITLDRIYVIPEARDLALRIYNDRCFDDIPALGDMLEKAGCADPAILDHCRQPGEHVRGCWVLDLILDRE